MSESLTKDLLGQLKTLCCPKVEIQWLQQDNENVLLITNNHTNFEFLDTMWKYQPKQLLQEHQ